jgi:hypothetical protein
MPEIDTSIYRPVAQPNPLDTLTKFGTAADALGNIAVGGAVQQAIDPRTGQIDRGALAGLLKQSQAGSMKAIPTMNALEQLRNAGFAADQQGLETFQKRMAITHHLFSSLASKDKPTIGDVYDVAAQALDPGLEAHKYGITMPVVMNALKQFRGPDGKPLPPEQIRAKALEIQTQAASTGEILQAHHPRYEVMDQGGQKTIVPTGTMMAPAVGTAVPATLPPTTPVATPEGTRYLGPQPPIPGGGAVRPAQGGAAMPATAPQRPAGAFGGMPTPQATGPAASLPPGFSEAASSIGAASAGQANALTAANDTSMVRKGMLGNLEEDLSKFTAGPSADWTRVAKAWVNRNVPLPEGWQFDPKSIASQEQFNKQAAMLAQQQFQAIGGTGTDAKFSSAFTTSPNETLSQLGNKGIIRLLKGNEDAIQAKNTAWRKWVREGRGPQTYPEFSDAFNERFDPRSFQFKYLPQNERQAYVDHMDPEERQQFLHNLTYARRQGWIRFDQPGAVKARTAE